MLKTDDQTNTELSESAKAFLGTFAKFNSDKLLERALAKNSSYSEQLDDLETQVDILTHQSQRAEGDLKKFQDSHQKMNRELAESKLRVQETQQKVNSLEDQLQKINQNYAEQKKELLELRSLKEPGKGSYEDFLNSIRAMSGSAFDPIFGSTSDKGVLVKLFTRSRNAKVAQFELRQIRGEWNLCKDSLRKTF